MNKRKDPMSEIANAMAFAQDVVELARKHGLIRAGRKANAPRAVTKTPRKARTPRANGHDADDFNTLTQ